MYDVRKFQSLTGYTVNWHLTSYSFYLKINKKYIKYYIFNTININKSIVGCLQRSKTTKNALHRRQSTLHILLLQTYVRQLAADDHDD